jgi:hypothetical protein
MQRSLHGSSVTYGLILGSVLGAGGSLFGQDDQLHLPPLNPAVAPLNPLHGFSSKEEWFSTLRGRAGFSEELVNCCAVVGGNLDDETRAFLVELAERKVGRDQHSALLDTDGGGTPLFEHLSSIAEGKIHRSLGACRRELLKEFIHELANPGELNQASWSVCGTAIVYPLFLNSPAESARLMRALVSEEGKCRLKDGSMLERAAYSLLPDDQPGRSISERLLMSAFMERANGHLRYCNVCDHHYDTKHGEIRHTGLTNDEIASLYLAITGIRYSRLEIGYNSSDILFNELTRLAASESFIPLTLKWNRSEVLPTTYRHALKLSEETHEPMIVVTQSTSVVPVDGYHFVLCLKVTPDRVYYRNSHGQSSVPAGTELEDPPRRVEDPKSGIESMTVNDFKLRLTAVFKEQGR